MRKQILVLCLFFVTVLSIARWDNSLSIWLNASDALIAIGLGLFLFILIYKQLSDFNQALSVLLIFLLGYVCFRNWIFTPTLQTISKQMEPLLESYIQRFPNLRSNRDIIPIIQTIMIDYQIAIWSVMHFSAVYLGVLLLNRKSSLQHPARKIRFPYWFVYLFITSLALTIYRETSLIGRNLLISIAMIYLMQGVGVLSFFWGDYFRKAKMIRTLLIMAIILNYPVLILIALLGVLDVWLNFRKLNIMEEIK